MIQKTDNKTFDGGVNTSEEVIHQSLLQHHESLKNLLNNDKVKSSIKKLREKSQRILASKFKQQHSVKQLAPPANMHKSVLEQQEPTRKLS